MGANIVPAAVTRKQATLVVVLTLVWGFNWPILKMGVMGYPPLTFRSLSMWLGLPFLGMLLYLRRVPLIVPRAHWRELGVLASACLRNPMICSALNLLFLMSAILLMSESPQKP